MTMSSDIILPEMLSRIFSFLSIEDRKQVRLVCKKWNYCCNCPEILRREKFVFRAGYSLQNIDLFLRNCEKIRNTVEFQGLSLDELSEDLWQIIGENIHSLKLCECTGTTEVTKNIFLHCLNMRSFKSSNKYQAYRSVSDDTLYSPAVWDELIQLNIERRKVIDFCLFIGGLELPNNVLQKIFKIFPSISNFGTGYPLYTCVVFNSLHQGSLQNTFNPALIQELTINVPCNGLWIQEFSEVTELKLQKLETILKNPTVSLDVFAQFLQNQRELKTLNIQLMTKQNVYTNTILFKILSICTKLLDFRFKCDAFLEMDEFFRALRIVSDSLLECFMIWFRPNIADLLAYRVPTYCIPSTNKRLRTLKLEVGVGLPEEYCLPILQHFHGLHHLDMAVKSDRILQTIFKYHINLQTLVVRNIHHCTASGFTGEELDSLVAQETSYSISRLQDLKFLHTEGAVDEFWIEKTIPHFNFPRLKYLRLTLWGLEKEMNLQFLPAMVPLTEVLVIDDVPLDADQYLFLCQNLQRLKILFYSWIDKEETIQNMFIAQPSLKYVVESSGHNAYFYNRFSRALSVVSFRDLQFENGVFYVLL